MAYALYNTETGEIVREYGGLPRRIEIPDAKCRVHAPEAGWTDGSYVLAALQSAGELPSAFHEKTGETVSYDAESKAVTKTATFSARPLAEVQLELTRRIELDAERVRAAFASPYACQIGVYLLKREQAEAVLALADPVDADPLAYPLVAADIGVDATDMQEAAEQIRAQAGAWEQAAAEIEHARRLANKQIAEAGNIGDAVAAYEAAIWPEAPQ